MKLGLKVYNDSNIAPTHFKGLRIPVLDLSDRRHVVEPQR